MQTLLKAFQLMGERPVQIFKLIGYQLLIILVTILFSGLIIKLPLLAIGFIPLMIYVTMFQFQAYQQLFLAQEPTKLGGVLKATNESFKQNGWRAFGFNCLMGLLMGLLIVVFMLVGMTLFLTLLVSDSANLFQNVIIMLLMAPVFMFLGYFVQYTHGFISLGVPKAMKQAFGQWKSILLCVAISTLLSFIPVVGTFALVVFGFVLPLKIVLDVAPTTPMSDESSYVDAMY